VAIVTLMTDFGTTDGYVGAMKGVLLSRAPGIHIVDITHELPRHDIAAAAYALTNSVPFFPPGTIHVCVVDPGVGGDRKPVIVLDKDQILVGPDNGLFSLVAPRPAAAYEISESAFLRDRPSATFHGRDIFAAAAAELARGGRAEDAGPQVVLRGRLSTADAPEGRSVTVAHVDVFGNLITNLPVDRIPDGVRFRVAGRDIGGLRTTFESVGVGELLAYVGSRQTLEIAVRNGNAAEMLGASRGTVIEVVADGEGQPR
jgi:S-adenosylmethionine hydrolase